MNAVATSAAADNGCAYGSDSDTSSDGSPEEYYQPISTVDVGGDDDEEEETTADLSNLDPNPNFQYQLPNGWVENGLSPLDLSDDDEDESEAERAIERAFREDEQRRATPLTAENTVRVMEAMRGVSFAGGAPDWARRVSEGEWVDRLRRLRGESSAPLN